MKWLILYLTAANILGFVMMGSDKKRARSKAWRISEKALFTCSILGGSIGTWAGMYVFRHKTRHWYFVLGMPAIFILQAICVFALYQRGLPLAAG